LTVYNNEFLLSSACIGSVNYRNHKIIKNLLLCLYFEIVRRRTDMAFKQRMGRWVMQLLNALLASGVNVHRLRSCWKRTFWARAVIKMMWC